MSAVPCVGPRVLIIGYGNPCRADDGLGPAFARLMKGKKLSGVSVAAPPALGVDEAAMLQGQDVVVFADADACCEGAYCFREILPLAENPFIHHLSPASVLAVARACLGLEPRAYVLGIRGYEFDVYSERLSERALRNLHAASGFLESAISDGGLARGVVLRVD